MAPPTDNGPISGGASSGWAQHASVLCQNIVKSGLVFQSLPFYYNFMCPAQRHVGYRYYFNTGELVLQVTDGERPPPRYTGRWPLLNL